MKFKDFPRRSVVALPEGPVQTHFPNATQMQKTHIICFGLSGLTKGDTWNQPIYL